MPASKRGIGGMGFFVAGAAATGRRTGALLVDLGLGLARQAAARRRFAGRLGGRRGLFDNDGRCRDRCRFRRGGGGRLGFRRGGGGFAFRRGGRLGFFRRRRLGGGAFGLGRRGVRCRGIGRWRGDRRRFGHDGRFGFHRCVHGSRFDRRGGRRGTALARLAATAIAASATTILLRLAGILLRLDRFRLRHRRRFGDVHGRVDGGHRFGAALGVAFSIALGGGASATATAATRLLLRFGRLGRHVGRFVVVAILVLALGGRLARREGQLVGLDVGDAAMVDRAGVDAAIGAAFGETLGGAATAATATTLAILSVLASVRLRLLLELLARLFDRRVLERFWTRIRA